MRPAVSVIIPVWNGACYLASAIESVLAQTMREFELIVVDDGSTDHSALIVRWYAVKDPRVILLQQRREGVSAARNLAIKRARCEWIACLDHDDLMMPTRLEHQLAFARAHPEAAAFGTPAIYVNAAGQTSGRRTVAIPLRSRADAVDLLIAGKPLGLIQPTVMMRRSAVLAIGGYDVELKVAQDTDLWLRLVQAGNVLLHQDEALTKYRVHDKSVTAQFSFESHRTAKWIAARATAWGAGEVEPTLREFREAWQHRPMSERISGWRRRYGWIYYRKAGVSLSNGDVRGFVFLIVALVLRPTYSCGRLKAQLLPAAARWRPWT